MKVNDFLNAVDCLMDFCESTGVPKERFMIFFTAEEEAEVARGLGIAHGHTLKTYSGFRVGRFDTGEE